MLISIARASVLIILNAETKFGVNLFVLLCTVVWFRFEMAVYRSSDFSGLQMIDNVNGHVCRCTSASQANQVDQSHQYHLI